MKYYTYILSCSDSSFYTGITTDLERRVLEHNGESKKPGAKYTATRRPVRLVYQTQFENRSQASKEEARIKKLQRQNKEKLILEYQNK